MWICLNNAFFSIVASPDKADDRLVVRARRKGDIERVFGVTGEFSPGRDYAYRVRLERATVADVLMTLALNISYGNFKSSVKDDRLHDAYARVWGVMGSLQVGGPYSRGPAGKKPRQRPLPLGHNYGPQEAARFAQDLPPGEFPKAFPRDPDMDGLAFVQPWKDRS